MCLFIAIMLDSESSTLGVPGSLQAYESLVIDMRH